MKAPEALVSKANAELSCCAVVWIEGPEYSGKDLVFLGKLPIFVTKERYDLLTQPSYDLKKRVD